MDRPYQEPLVEREHELATCAACVDSAARGTGRVLVLEGPAGIGKSALLARVEADASQRMTTTAHARGGELERAWPFSVVRQLFTPALYLGDDPRRRRMLTGAARLAAPVVGVEPGTPSGLSLESVLHGLFWLTANLADDGPLLLAIDDAHDADLGSRQFASYLAARIGALPVLLVMTTRQPIEAELAGDPSVETLHLGPLSGDGVAALVRARLAERADADLERAVHAATGGNPFLVRELLVELAAAPAITSAAVAESTPSAVVAALGARLGRLTPTARRAAVAAAVLGDRADGSRVAALLRAPLDEVARAADELADAAVIGVERPIAFLHPLLRSAALAQVDARKRAALHAAAARELAGEGLPAIELLPHLLACEPRRDSWVVDRLEEAARRAAACGAVDDAVLALQRALREPPAPERRPRLLLELGEAEQRIAPADARRHLEEALALTGESDERVIVATALSKTLLICNEPATAIAVLERELANGNGVDAEVSMRLGVEIAGLARFDVSLRRHWLARAPALADHVDDSLLGLMCAANLASEAALSGSSAEDAARLARHAVGDGRLLRERTAETVEFFLAAAALLYADRLHEARAAADQALADAAARGSATASSVASVFRARVRMRSGDLLGAEADASASLAFGSGAQWGPLAIATLVEATLGRGELSEARRQLESAPDAAWAERNPHLGTLLCVRGRVRQSHGDNEGALADALHAGVHQERRGAPNPAVLGWRSLAAETHRALGDEPAARSLVSEELALAHHFAAPRAIALARESAWAVTANGALDELEQVERMLRGSGFALDHARVLVRLGGALRRAGAPRRAREVLAAGEAAAQRCGGLALVRLARSELQLAGGRSPVPPAPQSPALTAAERRVAEAVAAGLSNRDAAQALFVAERTIESHLTSVYRKLGFRSRVQLVRWMIDQEEARGTR